MSLPQDTSILPSLLDHAPFVLVSHGIETDPIFNYGNEPALQVFGMTWQEFTSLLSRYSAEHPNREARERLLQRVTRDGYIDDYQGIRIAKDGRRFWISGATVWNVIDDEGEYHGQAAVFDIPEL